MKKKIQTTVWNDGAVCRAVVDDVGQGAEDCPTDAIASVSYTAITEVRRPLKGWLTTLEEFKAEWAALGEEIQGIDSDETDVGGNPIWGFYTLPNGEVVGNWGCDGHRLLFPAGEDVVFTSKTLAR